MGGWYTMGPGDDPPAEPAGDEAPQVHPWRAPAPDDEGVVLPPFRTLDKRARWVVVLLSLSIVASIAGFVVGGLEASLLDDLAAGKPVSDADLDASDRHTFVVGMIQSGVGTLTAAAFLIWFYRAYVNLAALGAQDLRFGRRWSVGGWFVPVLAAWRPKQVANDIWRASDSAAPRINRGWHNEPVSNLLLVWWIAWIGSEFLYRRATVTSLGAVDLSELQNSNTAFLLADFASIVAAALAIAVVRRMTDRQEIRATEKRLAFAVDDPPFYRTKVAWLTIAAVIVALALQALLFAVIWRGALDPVDDEAAPPSPPGAAGPVLRDEFDNAASGWVTETATTHSYDYIGGTYRIVVREANRQRHAFRRLGTPAADVQMDITGRLAGGADADGYGLSCWSGEAMYSGAVYGDGYWQITEDNGTDEPTALRSGTDTDGIIARGKATNDVHFDCIGAGTSVAQLTLTVNGQALASVADQSPMPSITEVGMFVESVGGDTDVRFDNLVVHQVAADSR